MPFYEYECASCKHYVEVMQKISDAPLRKCPSCGRNQLKKLVSAPVFRLKGSGWYETDFKSDKENKRNLAGAEKDAASGEAKESKPESTSDSGSESKSEAKPAAKESAAPPASKAVKTSRTASTGKSGSARKPAARAKAAAKGGRKGR